MTWSWEGNVGNKTIEEHYLVPVVHAKKDFYFEANKYTKYTVTDLKEHILYAIHISDMFIVSSGISKDKFCHI